MLFFFITLNSSTHHFENMSDIRIQYSEKYLKGKGVEFGALHNPLHVPEMSQVVYADRFTKRELIRRFPELTALSESIVETDITLDLNDGDFSKLKSHKFDFFIANHVIEHLINPLRFLKDLHDAMDKGSILYLSVPDKNYTFDKNRALTSCDHLWQDFLQDTRELSQGHLNDFILNITKDHIEPERREKMYFKNDKVPWNLLRKRAVYNLHKKRSIHVHVWNKTTFAEFLSFAIDKLQLNFTIIDSSDSHDNYAEEMIYILEKQGAS